MIWKRFGEPEITELQRLAAMSPHSVLGVQETASTSEIKLAYRRMAKIYHPDVTDSFMKQHNEQVLKILNSAYKSAMRNAR